MDLEEMKGGGDYDQNTLNKTLKGLSKKEKNLIDLTVVDYKTTEKYNYNAFLQGHTSYSPSIFLPIKNKIYFTTL